MPSTGGRDGGGGAGPSRMRSGDIDAEASSEEKDPASPNPVQPTLASGRPTSSARTSSDGARRGSAWGRGARASPPLPGAHDTCPPLPPVADKSQSVILILRRCFEGIPPLTPRAPCLGTSKAPCEVMVCPLPRACLIVRRLRQAY